MASNLLTELSVRAGLKKTAQSKTEQWLPDSDGRGSGRLQLRCKAGVGFWYFRYTKPDGTRDSLSIGQLTLARRSDTEGSGAAYTIAEARQRAQELAAMLKSPETADIRVALAAKEQARLAAIDAVAEAEAAERRAVEHQQRYTLGNLLELYCQHLSAQQKFSAAAVRAAIDLHLLRNNAALCAKPANQVKKAEIAQLVRGIIQDGKPRTAGMLRSYLHAAYRLAQTAEGDPQAPAELVDFNIEHNPVEGVKAQPVARRDRVLSEAELKVFLAKLENDTSIIGQLLRLCIYTGGQRPLQMSRVKLSNFDTHAGTLLLHDGKGKRPEPRLHLIPLGTHALEQVKALAVRAQQLGTPYLFTHDGKLPVQAASMGRWLSERRKAMIAEGQLLEPFQAKDLRRTAETMHAKMGVSTDDRAQVMSHGLGGVQDARYNRHDYLAEKRAVLTKWEAYLQAIEAGQTPAIKELPSNAQGQPNSATS